MSLSHRLSFPCSQHTQVLLQCIRLLGRSNSTLLRNIRLLSVRIPLGDVEHVLGGRFVQAAAVDGPQSA